MNTTQSGGMHRRSQAAGTSPRAARDGDGNYLATCRAQEPRASGTVLNVAGKVISIAVLGAPSDGRVVLLGEHQAVAGYAETRPSTGLLAVA